jgi:hypothetical protein
MTIPVPRKLLAPALFVLGLLVLAWPYGFLLSPLWGSLLLLGVGIGVLLGLAVRLGARRPRVVASVLLGAMVLGEAVFVAAVCVVIGRPYPGWPWMLAVDLVLLAVLVHGGVPLERVALVLYGSLVAGAILAVAGVALVAGGAPTAYLLLLALVAGIGCLVSVPGFAFGAWLARSA